MTQESVAILQRATQNSAGHDLRSSLHLLLMPGSLSQVVTSYSVELRRGYFGIVAPKDEVTMSGLEVKLGIVDWVGKKKKGK